MQDAEVRIHHARTPGRAEDVRCEAQVGCRKAWARTYVPWPPVFSNGSLPADDDNRLLHCLPGPFQGRSAIAPDSSVATPACTLRTWSAT